MDDNVDTKEKHVILIKENSMLLANLKFLHSSNRSPSQKKFRDRSLYRRAAPISEENATTRPQTRGPNENSAIGPDAADFELLLLLEVLVAVDAPLPADAVPVLPAPASCEPSPVRPGPVPAPLLKYWLAFAGIAGKASPLTNQVLDLVGQMLGEPLGL